MRLYRVIILAPAERDLDAIHWYVSRTSPDAAAHVSDQLLDAAIGLERFPLRYPTVYRRRFGAWPVRCRICLNYRILYQVRGSSVFVLRFLHASRRVPRRLWD